MRGPGPTTCTAPMATTSCWMESGISCAAGVAMIASPPTARTESSAASTWPADGSLSARRARCRPASSWAGHEERLAGLDRDLLGGAQVSDDDRAALDPGQGAVAAVLHGPLGAADGGGRVLARRPELAADVASQAADDLLGELGLLLLAGDLRAALAGLRLLGRARGRAAAGQAKVGQALLAAPLQQLEEPRGERPLLGDAGLGGRRGHADRALPGVEDRPDGDL